MLKETKKLDSSMIEMIFEVPAETFIVREAEALKVLGGELEIAGFRKGKAPEEVLKKHLPEIQILEKMAELVIGDIYPKIIIEEKIESIGRPQVTITKLARGNPLEFKVITSVLPEIRLPDYKKIAKEEWKDLSSNEIFEEDLEKAIMDVRKMRAHQKLHDDKGRVSKDDTRHEQSGDSVESSAESHDHPELKEENLPPLDDDFVKSLGNFKTIEEFREKMRDNLKLEKKMEQKNKNRSAVIERIAKE